MEVLLSKHQVLAALRFIRGIGGHDSISARKFLDAAKQAEDDMLFYTIFRFFEQRNQRLRGNPSFTPGKQQADRDTHSASRIKTCNTDSAGAEVKQDKTLGAF